MRSATRVLLVMAVSLATACSDRSLLGPDAEEVPVGALGEATGITVMTRNR